MSHLAVPGRRSGISLTVGLMAVIVVMPIPLGNLLPAIALALIGLGMVFRDGIVLVCGLLLSGVALLVTTGLLLAVWVWGSAWIMSLL